MRTIKLAMVLFLSVLVLTTLGNRLFRGFTVTGQGAVLPAPTNVAASDNSYSTKVGISWDTVRGATLYRIFRNTVNDPASAVVMGTTVEGTFFDPSGTAGQTFFYWVRAENGSVVSNLSAPDQGTRANGVINGPVPPLNPPPAPLGNPVTATK